MPRSLIGLGSNLGDRSKTLARAVDTLRAQPGVTVVSQSRWQRTAPIGGPAGQGEFLNGALVLDTTLGADALSQVLRDVETKLGRTRSERWGARTLDLDLLLYDRLVLETPRLVVPHPRMAFRRFVLESAADVAGEMIHPKIGWTIARLLEHLNTAPCYVALAGLPGVGKGPLAAALAQTHAGLFVADLSEPTIPAGQPLAAEIELLDRRADLLDAQRWANLNKLLVTDFWLDQALPYAQASLDEHDYQQLRLHWEKRRPYVLAPKLLVVIDPPYVSGLEPSPDVPRKEMLRDSLLTFASLPGLGPVLVTRATSAAEQLAEVSAAVQAMK